MIDLIKRYYIMLCCNGDCSMNIRMIIIFVLPAKKINIIEAISCDYYIFSLGTYERGEER